jgi:VanZ family protein
MVLYLTTTESRNLPKIQFPLKDKMVHFVFYFVMTFLWQIDIRSKRFLLYLSIISLGIFLEFYQDYFTTTRSFDLFDIVANISGVVVASLIFSYLYKNKKIV